MFFRGYFDIGGGQSSEKYRLNPPLTEAGVGGGNCSMRFGISTPKPGQAMTPVCAHAQTAGWNGAVSLL